MKRNRVLNATIILGILAVSVLLVPQAIVSISYPSIGPRVDGIQYVVIENETERVQALINGSIDLIASDISQTSLSLLEDDDAVSIVKTPGKETARIFINCAKYPLNLTAFRRALAYAINKTAICAKLFGGLAIPVDAYISETSPFSIEGEFGFSYYQGDAYIGNLLLNESGFGFDSVSGNRTAPDSSPLSVLIEHNSLNVELLNHITAAFSSLHINWALQETSFPEIIANVLNYDIYCSVGGTYDSFDIRNFANYFLSSYAGGGLLNLPNFVNLTMDTWSQQLGESTSLEGLFEAATEMQKIVAYECPVILLYDLCTVNAFRIDQVADIVALGEYGISNLVTNRLCSKLNIVDEYGGILRIGISSATSDLNFMRVFQDHWKGFLKTDSMKVLENLYDSLMITGPDGLDHPWLAESYHVETHDENSDVPEGEMEITFTIVDNATWADGTPITSQDVEFSLEFYVEGYEDWSNGYGAKLVNINDVSAPDNHTTLVRVGSTSYWDIHSISHVSIIPKHYFVAVGAYGWDLWNPSIEELVLSGQFLPVDGNIHNLAVNENHFRFNRPSSATTSGTPTTNTTTGLQSPDEIVTLLAIGLIIAGVAIVVVLRIRRK